jgi:parallel beta-helix repeat protein
MKNLCKLILLFSLCCVISCSGGGGGSDPAASNLTDSDQNTGAAVSTSSSTDVSTSTDTGVNTSSGTDQDNSDPADVTGNNIEVTPPSPAPVTGNVADVFSGPIYYIDPVNGNDSTGKVNDQNHPFQHWSAMTWTAGCNYLQKRGTTSSENLVTINASGTSGSLIVLGAYGEGSDPILNLPAGQTTQFFTRDKAYIRIQNLKFTGGSSGTANRLLNFYNCHDISISKCSFSSSPVEEAIIFFNESSSVGFYNLYVDDCSFTNLTETSYGECVRFYVASATDPLYDFGVRRATMNNVGYGVRVLGTESIIGANDNSPFGLDISNNIIILIRRCAIAVSCGLKTVAGHTNYISGNVMQNIGSSSVPNINAVQLNWVRNTIIEKNTIDTVQTSVPDGAGVILDWAWYNNTYISNGNTVRNNIVHGCNSGDYTAGISVYKASNNKIYNNYSYDNANGISLSNVESTGNVFYHNTAVNNGHSGLRIQNAGPQATLRNNIFANNSTFGVLVVNAGSVVPLTDYNCYYGNVSGAAIAIDAVHSVMITFGSHDIISNPLNVGYTIPNSSPCKDSGTALADVTTDILGLARPVGAGYDIGCYEWR